MSLIKEFKEGFKDFGSNITIIVNTILLIIIYLIGVGITSITAKIFKKKFLYELNSNKSYWNDLNLKKEQMENYYRQF